MQLLSIVLENCFPGIHHLLFKVEIYLLVEEAAAFTEGLIVHLPSCQQCHTQSYSIVADARDQAEVDFAEIDNGVVAVTKIVLSCHCQGALPCLSCAFRCRDELV